MQTNDELHMLMGDYHETKPYPSLDDYAQALEELKHPAPTRLLKTYDSVSVVHGCSTVATTNLANFFDVTT